MRTRTITVSRAIAEERVRLRRAERERGMTLAEAEAARIAGDERWQVCDVLYHASIIRMLEATRQEGEGQ